jgi:hypothetical protein
MVLVSRPALFAVWLLVLSLILSLILLLLHALSVRSSTSLKVPGVRQLRRSLQIGFTVSGCHVCGMRLCSV